MVPYTLTLEGPLGAVVSVLAVALTVVVCLGGVFGLLMWLDHLERTLPAAPDDPQHAGR